MIKRMFVLTMVGLIIGGVVGVLAVVFVDAVLALNELFRLSRSSREGIEEQTHIVLMTLLIPTIGGFIVGWIRTMMPTDRYQGPADAIRAALSLDTNMSLKSGFLSTLASCLSLGAGASVGQYGPLAHMGAYLGSWLNHLTHGDRSLGTISIACGVAAAISAAFHAPIAGLVFAREVILRHYSLRAFAPIAVSATLAYVVAHFLFQRTPLIRVEEISIASSYEYLLFVAIGLTGAVVATAFMRTIDISTRIAAGLNWPAPMKTALAGLALGLVALQVPDVLGVGQETLRLAMTGQTFDAIELAAILVAKLILTALCLGFGFSGGVFSPALLIGTLYGALIGTLTATLLGYPLSPILVYAVCGMVAVASPVIGAPLTTILIVFELTQNFDLATAAMISVAFANLIGFRIYGRSYFDVQLESRGFDLSLGRDKVIVQQHSIANLLSQDFTIAQSSFTLAAVRDLLVQEKHSEAYIVNSSSEYIGTLSLHRLMELITDRTDMSLPVASFAEPETLLLNPSTTIWSAMSDMEDFVGESIPVLADGKMVGVLFESTIVAAYLGILDDTRKDEHAAL